VPAPCKVLFLRVGSFAAYPYSYRFSAWEFPLFFSQKTIENSHVPKRQLYGYAANEPTLRNNTLQGAGTRDHQNYLDHSFASCKGNIVNHPVNNTELLIIFFWLTKQTIEEFILRPLHWKKAISMGEHFLFYDTFIQECKLQLSQAFIILVLGLLFVI